MIRRGHGIARLKLGTWQPQSCLQLFWDPLTPLLYSSLFRLLTSALLSLVCTLQISQCPLPLYSVTSPAPSLPLGSESACTALLLASLRALSLPSPHPALTLSSPCPHPVLTSSSSCPSTYSLSTTGILGNCFGLLQAGSCFVSQAVLELLI